MRLQNLKNIGHFFESLLAVLIYGYPAKKLKVIGVTGTDGKTTVTNLIYHLLKIAGKKTGMVSTIGARIGDNRLITTGLHTTTPSSFLIQKLLKEMVSKGCEYAVIEVTSHALDQYRVLGCNFEIGVITNIAHEHLDYHKSMDHYTDTKIKLFKNVKYGVLNNDDQQLKMQNAELKIKIQNPKLIKLFTYGIRNRSDLMAKDIVYEDSINFNVYYQNKLIGKLKTNLLGEYNVYNILAAVSVAKILGFNNEIIEKGIASFRPVCGRMEEVKLGQPFKVFIDFAHTPQAFQAILPALKRLTEGRVIHVFGATGRRDKEKRPLMGEISGKFSDLIVLTTEDTYGEDEEEIITALEKGVKRSGRKINKDYWIEKDRQKAINKAISLAKRGDTIVITGVGHQTAINKGKVEVPWSEYEAIKRGLSLRKQIT